MANTPSGPPGTTERTRRAILDAATTVYATDHHASLRDIARAAGVGRSTLHRYFHDRGALVRALVRDTAQATRRSFDEAELEQGTPDEAIERVIPALFELGPRLNFLFGTIPESEGYWDEEGWEEAHFPLGALFYRGQQSGHFDPEVNIDWFVRTLWYLISAGWEGVSEGAYAKHQAIAQVNRMLRFGLTGPPRPTADGAPPGA